MKLLKILLNTYKEEYELNLKEGLTKTTNRGKAINIIKKTFPNLEINDSKESNTFNIVRINEEDLPSILKLTNNLGWFPSWISSPFYNGKYSKDIKINTTSKIRFEAKYDEKVENVPEFLFHVTPSTNTSKIQEKGLSPKSRSKASYHPERIYLLKYTSYAIDLADMFYQKTGETIWDLLKINTQKIPGDYLKLYKDPNYQHGYYTLNNIPPQAIDVLDKIIL